MESQPKEVIETGETQKADDENGLTRYAEKKGLLISLWSFYHLWMIVDNCQKSCFWQFSFIIQG